MKFMQQELAGKKRVGNYTSHSSSQLGQELGYDLGGWMLPKTKEVRNGPQRTT